MSTSLTRLSLRLIVPAIALAAVIAAGEPLPADQPGIQVVVMQEADAAFALALRTEAASLPLAALRDAGEAPWVLAVRGQQLVRQPVRPGLRDPVSKLVAVEGIAAGTRWEDVPETWTCPDCGTTKDDFEMIELD